MNYKKIAVIFLALTVLFVAGCSAGESNGEAADNTEQSDKKAEEEVIPENAIAKVNDIIIKEDEFNKNILMAKYMYTQQFGEEAWTSDQGGQTLEVLVKSNLLEQTIQTELMKAYVQENSDYQVDAEEIEEMLKQFNTTLDQEEERKAFYKENKIDDEFIKGEIKKALFLKEFNNLVKSEVAENEEILEKLYAEEIVRVDASHILVEDKETADEIYQKLLDGADFVELAKEHSTGPSGSKGGALGYFGKGNMVPEFEKAAFTSEEGSITQPVETQFGFHIIKVNDQQTVNELIESEAAEETVAKFKNQLLNTQVSRAYQEKLTSLTEDATIKRYKDFLATNNEAENNEE